MLYQDGKNILLIYARSFINGCDYELRFRSKLVLVTNINNITLCSIKSNEEVINLP